MAKLRQTRADARQNTQSLLDAARNIFVEHGVDAPVRLIAEEAGVGVGTLYRHFPQRSDLIVAVFRNQMDICADAAPSLAEKYEPAEALSRWLQKYVDLLMTKRGLASALHSGDPAYASLPAYRDQRLLPALKGLLTTAVSAKTVRRGVTAEELLLSIATLCLGAPKDLTYTLKMVNLLVDGLRYKRSESGA